MTDSKEQSGYALGALRSLTPLAVEQLQAHWICTVEQLVAAAATEQGRSGLGTLVQADATGVEAILKEARMLLGEAKFAALSVAGSGGKLGARFDAPEGGSR